MPTKFLTCWLIVLLKTATKTRNVQLQICTSARSVEGAKIHMWKAPESMSTSTFLRVRCVCRTLLMRRRRMEFCVLGARCAGRRQILNKKPAPAWTALDIQHGLQERILIALSCCSPLCSDACMFVQKILFSWWVHHHFRYCQRRFVLFSKHFWCCRNGSPLVSIFDWSSCFLRIIGKRTGNHFWQFLKTIRGRFLATNGLQAHTQKHTSPCLRLSVLERVQRPKNRTVRVFAVERWLISCICTGAGFLLDNAKFPDGAEWNKQASDKKRWKGKFPFLEKRFFQEKKTTIYPLPLICKHCWRLRSLNNFKRMFFWRNDSIASLHWTKSCRIQEGSPSSQRVNLLKTPCRVGMTLFTTQKQEC